MNSLKSRRLELLNQIFGEKISATALAGRRPKTNISQMMAINNADARYPTNNRLPGSRNCSSRLLKYVKNQSITMSPRNAV